MTFGGIRTVLFLAMAISVVLAAPAFAHRFNVAVVIPLTGDKAALGSQIREGFMLATTERDSHADEESDGHLGGLDVYVSLIDTQGDLSADIARLAVQGTADIVAVLGAGPSQTLVAGLLEGQDVALLAPGQSPFTDAGQPGVTAFIAAYEKTYGAKPTPGAALGYNAARRIDVAVREQGAADVRDALRRNFTQTARGFSW